MAEADGQASAAPATQTSQAATESQSTNTGQQTSQQTPAQTEELFFDPESIKGKPELELAYKQMQADYTKKTTELKQHMQKVQAFDQFTANPAQMLQQLAAQYGFVLTSAQAQQLANQQQEAEFEPKSWKDVIEKTKTEAKQELLRELSPFLDQVKETRRSQIEKTLDDNCPDWRVYEDQMKQNLQSHPTLVNDPAMLYRLSVPPEVLESRAAQKALARLQNKAESSQLSTGSTTNQTAASKPPGKLNFDQAVQYAKAQLAAQGIKPPH